MNSGTNYKIFRFFLTGNKIMKPDGSVYSDAINTNNWDGGIDYGSAGYDESTYRVDQYLYVNASDGSEVSVAPKAESADI